MARMVHLFNKRLWAATFVVGCLVGISNNGYCQDTGPDKGAPKWGEFLRRFNKDPLLKPPFHNEEAEKGPKGLASKLRARELDIPNRKKAIRYLASFDCAQFPEAKEMLLKVLDPKEERWEEVRYEAAVGLRDMLARNACGPCKADDGKKDKVGRGGVEGPCHCTTCCDAKTMNTIARTAYEMKEDGCCYEPSLRVRQMAVEALKVCGVPCNYKPYYAEEPAPSPVEEIGPITPPDTNQDGPSAPKTQDKPYDSANLAIPQNVSVEPTPINRLTDVCIVGLSDGKVVRTEKQFSTTYRGRIYYFSSQEAMDRFTANPEQFAVAFGGCDPVEFVRSKKVVEGRYLLKHADRYYMFISKDNQKTFEGNPQAFLGNTKSESVASR
ncbi:MAG: YHS domain-containing protein [Planctomycetaceae bacterium]